MKISALVTNYNTWVLTAHSLATLLSLSGSRLARVLVIDDGSADPPPREIPDGVEIVRNERNLGYVASVNKGFGLLRGSDVVVLLDSDAYPLVDVALPTERAFREDRGLGALGMRTVDPLGRSAGSHAPEPTLVEFLLGQRAGGIWQRISSSEGRRTALYSCAMAVRCDAYWSVGGFDEGFDFLDADIDFSLRLQDAGWRVRVGEELIVCHTGGGSPQCVGRRVIRFHANRWRLLAKHGRLPAPGTTKVLLAFRHVAELAIIGATGRLWLPGAEMWREKVATRWWLLRHVWAGYRVAPRKPCSPARGREGGEDVGRGRSDWRAYQC